MLPMVFMAGFLTAVIFSIKFTGLINMLLISKVLLLQVALVLGKVLYGAKELFNKFSYPQPYYIPIAHGEHSHSQAYSHSRDDVFYPQATNNYYQQLPPPLNFPSAYQDQPQFNQPINYAINPSQNLQPHLNFGQPQSGLFDGISMQTPQRIRSYQSQQFSQPNYQDRSYNSVSDTSHSFLDITPSAEKPQSTTKSLTPQEMTQLLANAIAQVSTRTTQRSINFNFN